MTKYLTSFPSGVMDIPEGEFQTVVDESHAVVEAMNAAGVDVFGGGIEESVAPVRVAADGSVSDETYPGLTITGGFTVIEAPTREEAVAWARRVAVACRCPQELREFMYDAAS